MKMAKTRLCLLLVVVLLFGIAPGVFAEEAEEAAQTITFPDVDGTTFMGKAIYTLVEHGIITGYDDGQFKAELTITRAEFAKIIVCFLEADDLMLNMPSGFADVDNVGATEHWAKSYIKVARDLKIIDGFDDGLFHPDEPVTYEQAVKMIMSARGYTGLVYPEGYMEVAMQKKLFTGSNHTGTNKDAAKRGTIAILVYNAISIADADAAVMPTPSINIGNVSVGGGGGGSGSGSGGGGGGSSSSKSRTVDGIVTGTYVTMLYRPVSYLDEDEIYITSDDGDVELPISASINPANYLGRYVRATIKENSEGDDYISAIDIRTNKTKSTRFGHNDFISYENGLFTFYENNKVSTRTLEDTAEVDIIYNDKAIGTFDEQYILDFKIGDMTLISNDGDALIDVVIINSYKTSVVRSRNTSGNIQTVTCKFGADNLNMTERARHVTFSTSTGSAMAFSDIKANDVVDYKMSVDQERMEVVITKGGNAKTGKITQLDMDAEEPYLKIEGDNTRHLFNYNYLDYLNDDTKDAGAKYIPKDGDNVTIYFNKENRIAGMEVKEEVYTEKYGYIAATGYDHDKEYAQDETDRIAVKMYTMDEGNANDFKIIYIAENVIVDGTTYNKKPDDVRAILKDAATISNANKSTDLNKNTTYAQLVRYELENNQIKVLDTILGTPDTRYNKLTRSEYVYEDEGETAVGDGRFTYSSTLPGFTKTVAEGETQEFKVYTSGSRKTKVIFVPGNRNTRNLYKTKTFSTSTCTNGMRYYVEAYNINSNGYAEILLQYISDGTDELTADSTIGIVRQAIEYDQGGTANLMYYTQDGTPAQIKIDERLESDPILNELEEGDIIQFAKGSNGYAIKIRYVTDLSNRPIAPIDDYEQVFDLTNPRIHGFDVYPDEPINPPESIVARFRAQYGTAAGYKKETASSKIRVNSVLGTDVALTPTPDQDFVFDIIGSTRMFVYDGNEQSGSRVTTFRSKDAIDEWLEENLLTASEDYTSFEGLDQILVYTSRKSSGEESDARFIYVFRNVR